MIYPWWSMLGKIVAEMTALLMAAMKKALKLFLMQSFPCSILAHKLQSGFHYVSRNWRKAAGIGKTSLIWCVFRLSAKGGHPPGNVRFQ
jgi:hypothetical protein